LTRRNVAARVLAFDARHARGLNRDLERRATEPSDLAGADDHQSGVSADRLPRALLDKVPRLRERHVDRRSEGEYYREGDA
jgi:hypothetical protein